MIFYNMASRKGSLLEKNVAKTLEMAGLSPRKNVIIDGYEIDVLLDYKGNKVGIECKQYEKSNLTVRNLVHQWNSKKSEINLDKVALAIIGVDISQETRQLADKLGIVIWDEETFEDLFNSSIEDGEKVKRRILDSLEIDTEGESKDSSEEFFMDENNTEIKNPESQVEQKAELSIQRPDFETEKMGEVSLPEAHKLLQLINYYDTSHEEENCPRGLLLGYEDKPNKKHNIAIHLEYSKPRKFVVSVTRDQRTAGNKKDSLSIKLGEDKSLKVLEAFFNGQGIEKVKEYKQRQQNDPDESQNREVGKDTIEEILDR